MKIELKNLCPLPMRETDFSAESIWRSSRILESSHKNLVIAPSGTGKSSLVAFLFGMRRDFEGSILMDDKDTRKFSLKEWTLIRREKIACVMQDLRLIPELSVKENLALKNKLSNFYSESEILQHLEAVGMEKHYSQKAGTLSIGQQQRIAIVRALLQPFQFLILDEPFSHLDEENIKRCSRLIESACEKNKSGFLLFSLGDNYSFTYHEKFRL